MPPEDEAGALGVAHQLVVEIDPDPRDLAFLEERLAADAMAAVGSEEHEFGVFVRDDDGRILAGASGSVWGGGCQFHTVWVDPSMRGRHLGHEVLAAAEDEARRQGCRLAMGLTYDVLTAGFYEQQGWRSIGEIEDCPAGTTTRWFRKDLTPIGGCAPSPSSLPSEATVSPPTNETETP